MAARLQRRLRPGAGLREPLGLHGLEHVVHRSMLEGLQRVLVVGGHEHDQRQRAAGVIGPVLGQCLCGFEAGHAGHADVEKHDLGPQGQRLLDRRRAVAHVRHDAQLGPRARELGLQVGGEQRLVFGDQGGGVAHGGSGNRIVASVPPSESLALCRTSEARAP